MRKAKNSVDVLPGSNMPNNTCGCTKGSGGSSDQSTGSSIRTGVTMRLPSDGSSSPQACDHHEMEMSSLATGDRGSAETETLLPTNGVGSSACVLGSKRNGSLSVSPSAAGLGLFARLDAQLSRSTKFCLLVLGLFTFFGMHNFLQEKIMHFEGFKYGWFLGFLEVAGVTVFSCWERRIQGEHNVRRAALSSYVATTLCLMGSSSLSNIALNYINYPTKVVFRSCKLIPTMIMAGVMNNRRFSPLEYTAALAVCVGLILFAAADMRVSPSFSPWGLMLVSLSVCCDAVLPNLQEKLFAQGSSRLEVTFYSNVFTLLAMFGSLLLSGDMVGAVRYASAHRDAALWMTLYTLLAYVAISLHMVMVKSFGSVVAVLVGNSRKAMTITLSFLLFPKPFAPLYAFGGILVLGGISASAYIKNHARLQQHPKHAG